MVLSIGVINVQPLSNCMWARVFLAQGEAVGVSFRRRDEVHFSQILWFPAPAKGEPWKYVVSQTGIFLGFFLPIPWRGSRT